MSLDQLRPTDDDLDRVGATIRSRLSATTRHRRIRNRAIAIGVVGLVAIGTTAAAASVIMASNQQRNHSVNCFETASYDPDAPMGLAIGPSIMNSEGIDPNQEELKPLAERLDLAVELCAGQWDDGEFKIWEPETPSGRVHEVPEFTICQLPNGGLGVFPSERGSEVLCPEIGLAVPSE